MFLDVLLGQLSSVASAISAFEATDFTIMEALKTLFSRKFRHPKSCKSQQDNLHAVVFVQCACDITPAGTRKQDRHSFGDVVVRGFARVTVYF